jgi:hypothetical protein
VQEAEEVEIKGFGNGNIKEGRISIFIRCKKLKYADEYSMTDPICLLFGEGEGKQWTETERK